MRGNQRDKANHHEERTGPRRFQKFRMSSQVIGLDLTPVCQSDMAKSHHLKDFLINKKEIFLDSNLFFESAE